MADSRKQGSAKIPTHPDQDGAEFERKCIFNSLRANRGGSGETDGMEERQAIAKRTNTLNTDAEGTAKSTASTKLIAEGLLESLTPGTFWLQPTEEDAHSDKTAWTQEQTSSDSEHLTATYDCADLGDHPPDVHEHSYFGCSRWQTEENRQGTPGEKQELWKAAHRQLLAMGYEDSGGHLEELCMELNGDVQSIVNCLSSRDDNDPRMGGIPYTVFDQRSGDVLDPSCEGRRGEFDVPMIPISSNPATCISDRCGKERDAMAKLHEMQSDILNLPEQRRREAMTNSVMSPGASGIINMAQLADLLGQSGVGEDLSGKHALNTGGLLADQMPSAETPSSQGRRGGFDVPTIPSAGESMGHGLGKEHDAMAKLQEMQADILKLPDQQRREAITNIIASQGASGNINMAQLASLLGQSGLGLGEVFNGGGGGEAPFSGAGAGHMLSSLGSLSAMLQGGPLSRLSAMENASPFTADKS